MRFRSSVALLLGVGCGLLFGTTAWSTSCPVERESVGLELVEVRIDGEIQSDLSPWAFDGETRLFGETIGNMLRIDGSDLWFSEVE